MFILAFHLDAHQDKHKTSAQLCLLSPSGPTLYQSLTQEAIMPGQSISALDAFLLRLEPAWTLDCAGLSACLAVLPLGNLTVPKSAFDL